MWRHYFLLNRTSDSYPPRFLSLVNNAPEVNIEPTVQITPRLLCTHRYHFDAERLVEAQKLLQARHQQLVTSLVSGGRAGSALRLLALQLTAIQDFYSHSNWIDLEKNQINYALGMNRLLRTYVSVVMARRSNDNYLSLSRNWFLFLFLRIWNACSFYIFSLTGASWFTNK